MIRQSLRAGARGFVRCAVRSACALAVLLLPAAHAWADTVKVTVDRALVWTQPSGVAVVITQLLKDETAEVIRALEGWYEIVVPGNPLSDEIRRGYILASQVVVERTGPPAPEVVRVTTPPPKVQRPGTSFLHINGVKRESQDDLTQTTVTFSPALGESTTIATRYASATGVSFDIMAGGPVWRWVGLGWGIDYHQHDSAATIDALVPHPFFYDTFRPARFTTQPLRAREAAFHMPVILLPPMFGAVKVMAFGGLSVFRTTQTAITDITLDERFPYDTVTIGNVVTAEQAGTSVGYHAGADVSVYFTRTIGVGVGARYSRANIERFDKDAAATSGKAGGASVLAGLRIKF